MDVQGCRRGLRKKRLLFITNIPSPYRVNFFNELGKTCDLTVLFERDSSSERDDSWRNYSFTNFNGIILNGKKIDVDKSISFEIIKHLKIDDFDEIIVSNVATPTGMIAIQYMKLMKIPYWIEGDGAFISDDNSVKLRVKRHFLSGAKGYFSTSKMHDQYYRKYTSNNARIIRYPFSSISEKDILLTPATLDEKRQLKNQLGIKEEQMVISVGQMIPRKGFDVLINAAKELSSNIGFYIIGGVPYNEIKKLVSEYKLKNIHFIEFKMKNELDLYYKAADVFVLPTRKDVWGLVINEAMSKGLPVITTDKCGAGLELIKDGVNGYLVPTENANLLKNRINEILDNIEIQNEMSHMSLKIIHNYTIESMAKTHEKVLFGG